MARTDRSKIVQLVLGNESFERLPDAIPDPQLGPELTVKLAHFVLFLAEVEDWTGALRDDEMERVIECAVAASGFQDSRQARRALEWMFGCPEDLS
ncbi:MAG TPA: hypothetical protein VEV41_21555 [Terriglobales bacterium]|nr:hypothetical protein [Terriglobales bacterium]